MGCGFCLVVRLAVLPLFRGGFRVGLLVCGYCGWFVPVGCWVLRCVVWVWGELWVSVGCCRVWLLLALLLGGV